MSAVVQKGAAATDAAAAIAEGGFRLSSTLGPRLRPANSHHGSSAFCVCQKLGIAEIPYRSATSSIAVETVDRGNRRNPSIANGRRNRVRAQGSRVDDAASSNGDCKCRRS